jgi:hypothetical protein
LNIVILNWKRPLWEGDQKVVKRSGRDEQMWFAVHMCMEAMLAISLYSLLVYPKLGKHYVFLIISYVLYSTKLENKEGNTGSALKWGEVELAQTMYIHVSKYENNKMKEKEDFCPGWHHSLSLCHLRLEKLRL